MNQIGPRVEKICFRQVLDGQTNGRRTDQYRTLLHPEIHGGLIVAPGPPTSRKNLFSLAIRQLGDFN